MRVITARAITDAMSTHAQWRVGLKLWLDVFNKPSLVFQSFSQVKDVWRSHSGWNMDRIPNSLLKPESKKGPLDIYVFDIHKNECRVVVWLNQNTGVFYVKNVLSHAEYDRWWRGQTKSKR